MKGDIDADYSLSTPLAFGKKPGGTGKGGKLVVSSIRFMMLALSELGLVDILWSRFALGL